MKRRLWPAALLAFIVFAVFPATALATAGTRGLDYLHARQLSSGGFGTGQTADPQMTPWAIMAISAGGENPQAAIWSRGGKDPVDYLQSLDLEAAAGSASTQVNRASFYAKVILAYVAAGRVDLIGSAGSKGVNLVAKVRSYQITSPGPLEGAFSPWASTTQPTTNPYATVNTTIWAVLSLKAAGETNGGLDAAIAWLVAQQGANGGWGSQPSAATDVDDTAAAIMALRAPFYGRDGMSASDPVIVRALDYLRSQQRSDGGFPSMQTDGRSYAESTSWAIQAVVACGKSPASWDKAGHTPDSYLRSLQQSSGLFAHRAGAVSSPLMTTTEAIIALAHKPFPFGLSADPKNRPFMPRFLSFAPKGNPTYKTNTVSIKATYADAAGGTGINTKAVRVTVDTLNKTKAATVGSGSVTLTLTKLANGTHTVTIRIADRAGNGTSATHRFTVKVPAPSPSTPSGGSSGGGGYPTYRPTPPSYYQGNSSGSSTVPGTTPTPTSTPPSTAPGVTMPSDSGSVSGTPLGPYGTTSGSPLPEGAQPSPSASVTGQVTSSDGGGGIGMGGWIAIGLAALLPVGALGSFMVHRRQESALGSAGQGVALTGGGTSWDRFKASLFGVSSAMTLKR